MKAPPWTCSTRKGHCRHRGIGPKYRAAVGRCLDTRLPKWLADRFCEVGKHDVETDAYSCLIAAVGVDRVRQPGREQKQGPVGYRNHDLIRVLGGKFRDRWLDDIRLRPRIVEIDGVRPVMSL